MSLRITAPFHGRERDVNSHSRPASPPRPGPRGSPKANDAATSLLQRRRAATLKVASIEVPLLELLFDQADDIAFFVKDANGHYVAVNESLVTRHGLKNKAEVIGKRPCDICPGDFGRVPTDQDRRVLRTGRPLLAHLELQWYRPHHPVWCVTTKLPIHGADNEVIGVIGISHDVRAPIECQMIPTDLATALEEFERDLSCEVTSNWLARRSKLSPQRLARLTSRLFGITPTQLIAKTRITAATRLLRETSRSVSDIAHACGFYDHSAFTRAFRSATGVTPSEYRRSKS